VFDAVLDQYVSNDEVNYTFLSNLIYIIPWVHLLLFKPRINDNVGYGSYTKQQWNQLYPYFFNA
jgi:hypothetical protein